MAMGLREDDHSGQVPFSSHHVSSGVHAFHTPVTEDDDLGHLAEGGVARFLHCTVTL